MADADGGKGYGKEVDPGDDPETTSLEDKVFPETDEELETFHALIALFGGAPMDEEPGRVLVDVRHDADPMTWLA